MDKSSIRNNVISKFGKAHILPVKNNHINNISAKKIPFLILPHLSKKDLKKAKNLLQKNASNTRKGSSPLSYAQAMSSPLNILKIKEAFPILPNKKILEIHDAIFSKLNNKRKKIQSTTKEPFRKQAIVFVSSNLIEIIIGDTNTHIFQINNLLKNIKSILHVEFICLCPGSVSIITNNVPNLSNLAIMKKHFKLIEGINTNKILAPRLPN